MHPLQSSYFLGDISKFLLIQFFLWGYQFKIGNKIEALYLLIRILRFELCTYIFACTCNLHMTVYCVIWDFSTVVICSNSIFTFVHTWYGDVNISFITVHAV